MITWVYGGCFSLFLYLKSVHLDNIISMIPLFVACVVALLEIYLIYRNDNEYLNKVGMFVPFLSILILDGVLMLDSKTIYIVFSIVMCLDVLAVLYMGRFQRFFGPPLWLRMSNRVSFVCLCITYMLLYSVIVDDTAAYYSIFPYTVTLIVEIYVVYRLSRGMDTLSEERTSSMVRDRIMHASSIMIVFLVCVVHSLKMVPDNVTFGVSALIYLFGLLVYVLLNYF